jgi:hypothetical protein
LASPDDMSCIDGIWFARPRKLAPSVHETFHPSVYIRYLRVCEQTLACMGYVRLLLCDADAVPVGEGAIDGSSPACECLRPLSNIAVRRMAPPIKPQY